MSLAREPWYAGGLHFSCTRCSRCCRGGPGYVFLSKADTRGLLSLLGLDFATFLGRYCTLVADQGGFSVSLKEKKNYDCIFWSEAGCAVYEARPIQCSTFPFWSSILEEGESWRMAAEDCPGIGQGEHRSRDYIEERLWARRAAGLLILDRAAAKAPEKIDADTLLGS